MRTKTKLDPVTGFCPSPKIHPAMKEFLGYCLMKLAMQIRGRMEQKLVQFDMVAPQAAILSMLSKIGPMTQVELGELTAIDKATMVRLLDGLEKNQYLKRVSHKDDRRAKVLVISKEGEKVLLKIRKIRNECEAEILSPLTEKERELLRNLVSKVVLAHDQEE